MGFAGEWATGRQRLAGASLVPLCVTIQRLAAIKGGSPIPPIFLLILPRLFRSWRRLPGKTPIVSRSLWGSPSSPSLRGSDQLSTWPNAISERVKLLLGEIEDFSLVSPWFEEHGAV